MVPEVDRDEAIVADIGGSAVDDIDSDVDRPVMRTVGEVTRNVGLVCDEGDGVERG